MRSVASLSNGFGNACKRSEAQLSDRHHPTNSFLHAVVPPSQRPQHGVERDVPEYQRDCRNRPTFREEVRKELEGALKRHVAQYREPAKDVAYNIGTSEATVVSLRRSIPEAMITAAMLCRHYRGFRKAWAKVALMEATLDPDTARELNSLITSMTRGE